jgi:hypothetical protein
MALVGGGGSPNVAGGSFTGGSKALDVIGDFAYAYNQVGTAQLQSIANTLEFTTGNYAFVGHWTVCGAVNKDNDSDTGGIDQFYFKLNGTTVMSLRTDTQSQQVESPQSMTVPILIPPFTKVEAAAVCEINNDNWLVSNTLVGRIYA